MTLQRKRRLEHGRPGDAPPVRTVIREHHQAIYHFRAPALALQDHLSRDSDLPIERPQQLLDRHQAWLHLDDQGHAVGTARREDVDRPALAVELERRLDLGRPSMPLQERDGTCDQRGVILVKQAIELSGAPSAGAGGSSPGRDTGG